MSNAFKNRRPASVNDTKAIAVVDQAPENFEKPKSIGMTFVMEPEWHSQFKVAAAMQGISMREFLVQLFEEWKRNQR